MMGNFPQLVLHTPDIEGIKHYNSDVNPEGNYFSNLVFGSTSDFLQIPKTAMIRLLTLGRFLSCVHDFFFFF